MRVESCTNFSTVSLGKIHDATLRVSSPTSVKDTHHQWISTVSTNQCPECIRPFFPYREELTDF